MRNAFVLCCSGCPVGYGRNGKRSRLDEIEMGTERRDRRRQLHDAGARREGRRAGQDRQDLCARHPDRLQDARLPAAHLQDH
mgnify:CR=1 FL=1